MWSQKNLRSLILLMSVVCGFLPPAFSQPPGNWNEIKGTHFIVYYQGREKAPAQDVLRNAESYYKRIANDLGYSRRSDFWLWDKRCTIFLYDSKAEFQSANNQPVWSSGFAVPEKRQIVSYLGSTEFVNSVLPHELAHLIFRDFVGVENESIPLWLDEGLAMAQEESKRPYFDRIVEQMVAQSRWIPFRQIVAVQSASNLPTNEAALFYAQSQSMVRFLLKANDPGRFVQFCRDLRDGKPLEASLRKNYPRRFDSLESFERAWAQSHA